MINDETIEFARGIDAMLGVAWSSSLEEPRRSRSAVIASMAVTRRDPTRAACSPRRRRLKQQPYFDIENNMIRREERVEGRGGPLCVDQGHV